MALRGVGSTGAGVMTPARRDDDKSFGLVLSRKPNEQIVVGSDIIIRVSEIKGDKVVICFDAPPEVRIRRAEVTNHNRTKKENAGNGLFLSRKKFEQVILFDERINQEIVVTVTEIRAGQVRIGTKADETVPVNRLEVLTKAA